jgi:hypothetical protein
MLTVFAGPKEIINNTKEEKTIMFCCFAIFAGMFPRLADIIIWIARPVMFNAAFGGSWLWPILGIIFLPFTTLMYIILWSPGIGLTGWDWLWLILAVVLDVTHWSQMVYNNRKGVPGYTTP